MPDKHSNINTITATRYNLANQGQVYCVAR
jgi:hypothetical protein